MKKIIIGILVFAMVLASGSAGAKAPPFYKELTIYQPSGQLVSHLEGEEITNACTYGNKYLTLSPDGKYLLCKGKDNYYYHAQIQFMSWGFYLEEIDDWDILAHYDAEATVSVTDTMEQVLACMEEYPDAEGDLAIMCSNAKYAIDPLPDEVMEFGFISKDRRITDTYYYVYHGDALLRKTTDEEKAAMNTRIEENALLLPTIVGFWEVVNFWGPDASGVETKEEAEKMAAIYTEYLELKDQGLVEKYFPDQLYIEEVAMYTKRTFFDLMCSDVNGDGQLTVADVVALRQTIMSGDVKVEFLYPGNTDDNNLLNVYDVVNIRTKIMVGNLDNNEE